MPYIKDIWSSGRFRRRDFWMGSFLLVVATIALQELATILFVDIPLFVQLGMGIFLNGLTFVLMLWRRHDRNSRGWDVVGYIALVYLLQISVDLTSMDSTLTKVLIMIWAVYTVLEFAICGFLEGDDTSNDYGPNPHWGRRRDPRYGR